MSSTKLSRELEKLFSIAEKAIEKNDFGSAINNLEKIIINNQNNPRAWSLMSKACKKMGKLESAESFIVTSLKLDSNSYDSWVNLAEIYIDKGELDKGKFASEKACELEPNGEEGLKVLANVYLNQKKYKESLVIFEKIHEINPKNIFGNWGISYCLYKLGRIKDCKPYLDNLIEAKTQLKFTNLIHGYYMAEVEGEILESLKLFHEELKLDPDSPCANGVLGRAYTSLGETETAYLYETKQLMLNKTVTVFDNFLMHIHYNPKISNQEILNWAEEYQKSIYPEFANTKITKETYPNTDFNPKKEILKIGFVSGDFRKHAIFSWLKGLLKQLNAQSLEIYCYCNNKHDVATELWKSEVPNWRDIKDLDDQISSEIIRSDGIDILVDLSGHTAHNRLGIFAMKPAPVQVTWLGQSSPIGIKNIDFTISDEFLIKPDEDQYYLQKVYRMPNYFAVFQPPEKNIDIHEPPCLKNNFVTFGCFNNFMKINSRVIDTWIKILKAVPNSRLALKAKVFKDKKFQEKIINKFAEKGIEAERIILELHDSNKLDYLAAYNQIDIALDPFPLGGGTTSHDLIWMGVPLIALYGERMSARISAGILHNIKTSELIAYSIDDYINKAIDLARNFNKISSYKKNLRKNYLSSPCCDKELFSKQLNNAFRIMWQEISTKLNNETYDN
jgi:predicted O-linked N-acetylglucosamine transferase (SPINDLY family)/Tfp pilus assembly protein PilF